MAIHWRSPVLMVGALICGILFSVGHHLFYLSFDREPAPTRLDEKVRFLGTTINAQQRNTAIGTAFAFLVRACLVFAVSTGYLQAMIWSLSNSEHRSIPIGNMNVIGSVLGNLISLVNLKIWWRRPILFVIALAAWLIPIATIITPATLSVATDTPPAREIHVPRVDFTSFRLVEDMIGYENGFAESLNNTLYNYNGPGDTVRSLALATAARGEILPVEAPAANSSWTLSFAAPVMSPITEYVPFQNRSDVGVGQLATLSFPVQSPGYNDYREELSVMIAITPAMMATDPNTTSICRPLWAGGSENTTFEDRVTIVTNSATVIQCGMHNSTYKTDFKFENGLQTVKTTVLDVNDTTMIGTSFLKANFSGAIGYDRTTETATSSETCPYLASNFMDAPDLPCTVSPQLLSQLSYQAVYHAFINSFTGLIQWYDNPKYAEVQTLESTSSVLNTILGRSPELAFLSRPGAKNISNKLTLQQYAMSQDTSHLTGLHTAPLVPAQKPDGLPLERALEELFQNITISLMGAPDLQANASSAFYPGPTLVEYDMRNNVYAYAASKFWIASGLAIAVATIVVIFGCAAIVLNQASYSNDFSTWLRLSLGSDLSQDIAAKDLLGEDPLPEYIASTTIRLPQAGREYVTSADVLLKGRADNDNSKAPNVLETAGRDFTPLSTLTRNIERLKRKPVASSAQLL
ncbi:hypothetical protein PRZ48_014093 [Zasmidium cellare]|uniref:Uncharacterized protein n=1 Tax=Zasmidium cellare TaxID=395010 RepID=A0ABR0DZZ1_ZASCE|nr:hypothetical protein PRZ48_014093 [Zasmidium cellare]